MRLDPQVTSHPDPDGPTPSQTIGPFFRFGMVWMDAGDLVAPGTPGAVVLTGRVLDGAGDPVPDAMVEIWQAGTDGAFDGGAVGAGRWSGFGRSLTDADGRYRFTTVRPGAVDDVQAPHIDMSIFARGLLQRLVTRLYLPGHAGNDTDPVLAGLDGERRATLVATAGRWRGDDALELDIRLQGPGETVFFVW